MKLGPLRVQFDEWIRGVDQALVELLQRHDEPRSHYGMMWYHFGFADERLELLPPEAWLPRGKRIRAIFSWLVGKAVAAPPEASRALMLAGEIMHNASLIHDDIQDGSPMRWGRPTLWKQFGVPAAINVGDAMIFLVFEQLGALHALGVPPERVQAIVRAYTRTQLRMAEGQHLDLMHQGRRDISCAQYIDTIDRKTAAAAEGIAWSAALLSGSDRAEQYRAFGRAFGLLYQLCDDVRAVWGASDETGKEALDDLRARKATLPVLYGVEHGPPALRERLLAPDEGELDLEDARWIRDQLTVAGIRERCAADAEEAACRAFDALAAMERVPAHDWMEQLITLTAASAGIDVEPAARARRDAGSASSEGVR